MAEKKLMIENRGEKRYVYRVQNIYNPVKKRTDKKKEYCGVFTGTYDAEGKPEFRKARLGYAPAEEIRFRDAFYNVVENSLKSSEGITWSETKFKSFKNKDLIYFFSYFEPLSCYLEMYVPLETEQVYCRFFQFGNKKAELESEHNIVILFGRDIDVFKKFLTGDTENQVVLCDNKLQQDKLPEVYTGSTIFAYSKNQDQLKEIRLLAESYEVIERVIIPYLQQLPNQREFKDKKGLEYLSKLCTNILSVLLQIEIPENINRSNIIIDLMSMNSRFIKIGGKWILLEERVTMPIGWPEGPRPKN
ncbi:MAG: hypothetical protein JEY71_02185 [Sphaerochaeta sp.]|nr:hypothetical protein [Sphaerochaeta sp.]